MDGHVYHVDMVNWHASSNSIVFGGRRSFLATVTTPFLPVAFSSGRSLAGFLAETFREFPGIFRGT